MRNGSTYTEIRTFPSISIIAVQNAVGTSAAQQTPMKVQICDDLLHCVQLTPIAHRIDTPSLPS